MATVEEALQGLIGAILESEQYREFDRQRSILNSDPALKKQVDAYRLENFALQRFTDPEELLDKTEEFTAKYEEWRNNEKVESFLRAELDFCRMIQGINQGIMEAVHFE